MSRLSEAKEEDRLGAGWLAMVNAMIVESESSAKQQTVCYSHWKVMQELSAVRKVASGGLWGWAV